MSLADTLGTCPDCETPIPATRVLIEYQRGNRLAVYAECPDCREVVHPA